MYRCISIRPTIALIPNEGEIQNAPSIQIAALYYMTLRTLSGYDNEALL